MGLTKDQIEWLNSCHGWAGLKKTKWTFNEETGLVDVEGDFITPNSYGSCKALGRKGGGGYGGIKDFMGIKFGTVTGTFDCSYNNLTNIEGAPIYVGGDFDCSYNKLTSLVGAPQEVGGSFSCIDNNLTSLIGSPRRVKLHFHCAYNKLPNLVGAPMYVGGDFWCTDLSNDLHIESLHGAEECIIGGDFDCHYNKLKDLKGAPRLIYGQFMVYGNYEGNYKRVKKDTFILITSTMEEKNLDYFGALCLLKDSLDKKEWNKLSKGIDERLSKEAQKGLRMLDKLKIFE